MQPAQPEQPDPLVTKVIDDGQRLDRAVADWRGLPRAAVLRLLEYGAITCNGKTMRRSNKGDLLRAGDRLTLAGDYARGEAPLPDDAIGLDIVQAGDGWLIVNRPAGMPVRPHALDETGTVVNAVAARCPEMIGVGEGGLRSGVVHRLDTDTSGALLVATRQDAWERLRAVFAERRVEKRYLALVRGTPMEKGAARRDLRVASHQPARVEVEPEGKGRQDSRTCSLSWHLLERLGERASLIEVDLHTGFLHQIRAMMCDLGHPVIGDHTYGSDLSPIDAPRQMLHAKSLAFGDIRAEAPMPGDMQRLLKALCG